MMGAKICAVNMKSGGISISKRLGACKIVNWMEFWSKIWFCRILFVIKKKKKKTLVNTLQINGNIKTKVIGIYQIQWDPLASGLRNYGLHLTREFKGYSNKLLAYFPQTGQWNGWIFNQHQSITLHLLYLRMNLSAPNLCAFSNS